MNFKTCAILGRPNRWTQVVLAVAVTTGFLGQATPANAADVLLRLNKSKDASPTPAGPPPWLEVDIDSVSATSVRLTLTAVGLTDDEFVSTWRFNLNPVKFDSSDDLVLGSVTVSSGTVGPTSASFSPNSFSGGGLGAAMDLDLSFPTSGSGGGINRFRDGDAVQLLVTAAGGIVPEDFLFVAPGSNFQAISLAHVQAIGNGDSQWIYADGPASLPGPIPAIPEPSTWAAIALAVAAVGWTKYCWDRRQRGQLLFTPRPDRHPGNGGQVMTRPVHAPDRGRTPFG